MLISLIFFHLLTDGDMITIADSSDLNLAKQLSRLLKITVFSKSHPMHPWYIRSSSAHSPPQYIDQTTPHLHMLLPSLQSCNTIWGGTPVILSYLPKSNCSFFLVVGKRRMLE